MPVSTHPDLGAAAPQEEETVPAASLVQEFYLKLLQKYYLDRLLSYPILIFNKCADRGVKILRDENTRDYTRALILNAPMLSQKIQIFKSHVLFKTHYTEIQILKTVFGEVSPDQVYYFHLVDFNANCISRFVSVLADSRSLSDNILDSIAQQVTEEAKRRGLSTESSGRKSTFGITIASAEDEDKSVRDEWYFYQWYSLVNYPDATLSDLHDLLQDKNVKSRREAWLSPIGDTPLHMAARAGNTQWTTRMIPYIMDHLARPESGPWKPLDLINHLNNRGETALHMAIINGATAVAHCLIDYAADFQIVTEGDKTALELMYQQMPEGILYILDKHGVLSFGGPDDKELELKLDVTPLVPAEHSLNPPLPPCHTERESKQGITMMTLEMDPFLTSHSQNQSAVTSSTPKRKPLETAALAKLIYGGPQGSMELVLSHAVTQAFVELKWKRLRFAIFAMSLLYIGFYVFSAAVVAYLALKLNSSQYPKLGPAPKGFTNRGESEDILTSVDELFLILLVVSCIPVILMEVYEIILARRVVGLPAALKYYCFCWSLENLAQWLLVISLFIFATAHSSAPTEDHAYLSMLAAVVVISSGFLCLLQLANIPSFAIYVHMFNRVLWRFVRVLAVYACLLIAFAVAFSIIFPRAEKFAVPRSLPRIFAMFTGDLNFDDTFNPEHKLDFPVFAHTVQLAFIISLTIVLMNLLTGLAVDDVNKIAQQSEVIKRAVQVERLYMMESIMSKFPCAETSVLDNPRGAKCISLKISDVRDPQVQKGLRELLQKQHKVL